MELPNGKKMLLLIWMLRSASDLHDIAWKTLPLIKERMAKEKGLSGKLLLVDANSENMEFLKTSFSWKLGIWRACEFILGYMVKNYAW